MQIYSLLRVSAWLHNSVAMQLTPEYYNNGNISTSPYRANGNSSTSAYCALAEAGAV